MGIIYGKLIRTLAAVVVICGMLAGAKEAEEAEPSGITTAQQAIQALKEAGIIYVGKRKEARVRSFYCVRDDEKAQGLSKELMAHYAAFQKGSETLKDYPYIETIIQLFKYRQNKQAKFPAGALEPFYAAGCRPKGIPLLTQACYRPRPEKEIKALLKLGANPNDKDADDENALHTAARCKLGAKVLQTIHKAGADINAANKHGYTPLHLATQAGSDETSLRTLLKAGADPKAQTTEKAKLPPVMVAMESCTLKSITAMMKAGLDLNEKNASGFNALSMLGEQNITPEEMALFLKAGINLNEKLGTVGSTPATMMLMKADEKLLRALLAAKADFSMVNNHGRNALHYLVLNKKLTPAMLDLMLKEQKKVNTVDKLNQHTPLHLAILCGCSAEIVKKLLDAGANKNLKNWENKTALDLAREKKREDIIKLLSN